MGDIGIIIKKVIEKWGADMLGFWNRKEVYVGYDMRECGDIRDILRQNSIKYTYKVVDYSSRQGRSGIGSFNENPAFSCMYYIYVHKKDYDNTCYLIGKLKEKNRL